MPGVAGGISAPVAEVPVKPQPVAGAGGSPARASLWFGAALYFNSGLLFITTPIFTRLLTTAEYGQVVLFNSWSTVLGIFATLSLSGGVFYNAMLEFGDGVDAYLSSMLALTTVSVLACFAMVSAVYALSGDFTGLGYPLLCFMFVNLLFNAVLMFWRARERFHYRYRLVVGVSIPSSLIGILGAIALVAWIPVHRVESRIIAAALPLVIVGIVLYVLLLRRGGVAYSRKYWGYALAMNIPLLPHYISQAFVLQFDRFAIEQTLGKDDVGIYGLALAVATGVTLFWTAINASWLPWMLKKLKEARFGDIAHRAQDLATVVALVCVLLSLLAPEVVRLLAPPAYRAAAMIVPMLLLASYLQFVQSFFLNVQFFRKKAAAITACSLIAAALAVAGNLVLIERFGLAAAAYVAVASQFLQLGFHYVMVRRRQRVKIIGDWQLAAITAAATAATFASTFAASQQGLRLALAAACAAMVCALVIKRMPELRGRRG
jgi:O-antigen/teichoic acid export membrane protein